MLGTCAASEAPSAAEWVEDVLRWGASWISRTRMAPETADGGANAANASQRASGREVEGAPDAGSRPPGGPDGAEDNETAREEGEKEGAAPEEDAETPGALDRCGVRSLAGVLEATEAELEALARDDIAGAPWLPGALGRYPGAARDDETGHSDAQPGVSVDVSGPEDPALRALIGGMRGRFYARDAGDAPRAATEEELEAPHGKASAEFWSWALGSLAREAAEREEEETGAEGREGEMVGDAEEGAAQEDVPLEREEEEVRELDDSADEGAKRR